MGLLKSLNTNELVQNTEKGITVRDQVAGVLFTDDFSGTSSQLYPFKTMNGVEWGQSSAVASIATNWGRSGNRCCKIAYPQRNSSGYSKGQINLYLRSDQYKEVWLEWYMYLPDGTEGIGPRWEHLTNIAGNTSNNKYMLVYGPGRNAGAGNDWWLYGCEGDPSNTESRSHHAYRGNVLDYDFTRNFSNCLPKNIYTFRPGKWIRNVIHVRLATWTNGVPNKDGILKHWIDNELAYGDDNVGSIDCWAPNREVYDNITLAANTEAKCYIDHLEVYGWCNGGFAVPTNVYFDDITLSTTPIL